MLFRSLARQDPRRVSWLMAAIVGLATVPSILLFITTDLATARWMLWLVVPAIYFFIGPTMGLLQNVVPVGIRSQTIAVLMFVANVFNLIIGPQVVGLGSDALAPVLNSQAESLRIALLCLAPTGFWGAWHYYASARTLRDAQRRASGT